MGTPNPPPAPSRLLPLLDPGGRCALILLVLAGLAPDGRLQAQTVGATVSVVSDHTFVTLGQSMWGPGAAPSAFDVTLFDIGPPPWDATAGPVSWFSTDPELAEFGTFGGSVSGSTSGEIGLSAVLENESTGEIDLTYPVRVQLLVPEANSFRDGEEVAIQTGWSRLPSYALASRPGASTLSVDGVFEFAASATVQGCVVACVWVDPTSPPTLLSATEAKLLDVDIPRQEFTLLEITSDGRYGFPEPLNLLIDEFSELLGPDDDLRSLPHTFSQSETAGIPFTLWPGHGVSGIVDVPRTAIPCPDVTDATPDFSLSCSSAVAALDGRRIFGTASNRFMDVSVDLDHWLTLVLGLALQNPPKFGEQIPIGDLIDGAEASYNLVDVSVPMALSQSQTFSFDPDLKVSVQVADAAGPVPVVWRVTEGSTTVASGTGATIPFTVGQTLRVTFPPSRKTPLNGGQTFTLRNTFSSQVDLTYRSSLTTKFLDATLVVPETEIIPSIELDICDFFSDEADPLDLFPDSECESSSDPVTIPGIDLTAGPAYEPDPLPLVDCNVTLFPADPSLTDCSRAAQPASWELQGFEASTGTPFVLDPEDPGIAVETTLVSGLATKTGPAGTLVQTLQVNNTGDVPLSATQIEDAIALAFADVPGFSVADLTSLTLTVDGGAGGYDGDVATATLEGVDVLPVGGAGAVTVVFDVEPGNIYSSAVLALATSPIGTLVTDDASARFGVYPLDIGPLQINTPDPEGVLPVDLLSTPEMDVQDLDPSTILLDGVAPLRWSFELAEDGVLTNLALKFDRSAVSEAASSRLAETTVVAAEGAAGASAGSTARMAALLLSGDARGPEGLAADRLGNRNGRLDVGDLRAAALADPSPEGVRANAPMNSSRVALPLTGFMTDGTPFVGEDVVRLNNSEGTQ